MVSRESLRNIVLHFPTIFDPIYIATSSGTGYWFKPAVRIRAMPDSRNIGNLSKLVTLKLRVWRERYLEDLKTVRQSRSPWMCARLYLETTLVVDALRRKSKLWQDIGIPRSIQVCSRDLWLGLADVSRFLRIRFLYDWDNKGIWLHPVLKHLNPWRTIATFLWEKVRGWTCRRTRDVELFMPHPQHISHESTRAYRISRSLLGHTPCHPI